MTSKRCFSKLLKEDFRHKIWMLVLSILGNLLAIPVCFLLRDDGAYTMSDTATRIFRSASGTVYGFETYISVTAGIIAFAGALIVGLAGFRYVFHRDMTDTYHSIPVRRRTLFLVNWLNGFFIWFVPFVACMLGTMAFAAGRLGRLQTAFETAENKTSSLTANFAKLSAGKIFEEGLLTILTLTVVFLLVYHLVLAAVMLCGNVLNTLAVTAIAGVGVIALYMLDAVFRQAYFTTYVGLFDAQEVVVYASPLASAVWTLNMRQGGEAMGSCLAVNAVIALLLLAAAVLAYLRRPSELAETGITNRALRLGVQTVATCTAGMGGWLVFYYLTESLTDAQSKAWGVFGALLAAVLVSGAMDILFQMDFKAFFAHRVRMAVTSAAVLLVCFCFSEDWLGYDSYLPKKDKIAELSVYAPESNSLYQTTYMSDTMLEKLEEMHYTDVDVIYDYLETAVAASTARQEDKADRGTWEQILTRVTLKNGMSYYRWYQVYSDDNAAALKILAGEEYQELYYRISEEELQEASGLVLETWGETLQQMKGTDISAEKLEEIWRACNQDMREKPELLLGGGGRVFSDLILKGGENSRNYRRFPVYEEMTHTREALRKYGYGEYADPKTPEEVEKIKIYLGLSGYELKEQDLDPVEEARSHFGVEEGAGGEQAVSTEMPQTRAATLQDEELVVEITDKQEIEELLGILSYVSGEYAGAFRRAWAGNIRIVTEDGLEQCAYVQMGMLPEKYLLRFGEPAK